MNGSYLKFLPKEHRLKALRCKEPKKDKIKKEFENNLSFVFFKYLISFHIKLPYANKKDTTLHVDIPIQLIENDQLITYNLLETGIPLPFENIYRIIDHKRFSFALINIPLYQFAYKLNRTRDITKKQFPFSLRQTDYHYFYRTLEGGTMIKIKDDKKEDLPVVHSSNTGLLLTYTSPRERELDIYTKCIDTVNSTLSAFFSKINELSKTNTSHQTLKEIIKKCAEYDYLNVKMTTLDTMFTTGKISNPKKQKTMSNVDKAQPLIQSCKVAGCSMMNEDEMNDIVYEIKLYKKVLESDVSSESLFMKTNEGKFNYSFNLCQKHGKIVVCVWFLLNLMGIMAYDVLTSIHVIKTSSKFQYAKKTVYGHYCDITKKEHEEKIISQWKRINYSILFVNEWIKFNAFEYI
jgi:hypothetical protein